MQLRQLEVDLISLSSTISDAGDWDRALHLLQHMQLQSQERVEDDGAEHLELPLAGFVEDARKDPIVARVEERIANATGIPVHPHEDLLSFTRVQSRGSKPREGYFPPDGLHHDSHQRPHRAWSMIVYLQVPEEGGRTIFPLAGPVPKDGDLAMRHDLYGGKEQNYSRRAYFDVSSDHPFMDLIEESCRGEYGLSLQVSPGTAVLFPSSSRSVRSRAWQQAAQHLVDACVDGRWTGGSHRTSPGRFGFTCGLQASVESSHWQKGLQLWEEGAAREQWNLEFCNPSYG
eukprot:g18923.t1